MEGGRERGAGGRGGVGNLRATAPLQCVVSAAGGRAARGQRPCTKRVSAAVGCVLDADVEAPAGGGGRGFPWRRPAWDIENGEQWGGGGAPRRTSGPPKKVPPSFCLGPSPPPAGRSAPPSLAGGIPRRHLHTPTAVSTTTMAVAGAGLICHRRRRRLPRSPPPSQSLAPLPPSLPPLPPSPLWLLLCRDGRRRRREAGRGATWHLG